MLDALCHILYPQTSVFRMDSNSTSYTTIRKRVSARHLSVKRVSVKRFSVKRVSVKRPLFDVAWRLSHADTLLYKHI